MSRSLEAFSIDIQFSGSRCDGMKMKQIQTFMTQSEMTYFVVCLISRSFSFADVETFLDGNYVNVPAMKTSDWLKSSVLLSGRMTWPQDMRNNTWWLLWNEILWIFIFSFPPAMNRNYRKDFPLFLGEFQLQSFAQSQIDCESDGENIENLIFHDCSSIAA